MFIQVRGVSTTDVAEQLPYIQMSTVDGSLVPWVASHTDLLSDDWSVVEDVA
jgi:Protein of unknown function (DUF2829)